MLYQNLKKNTKVPVRLLQFSLYLRLNIKYKTQIRVILACLGGYKGGFRANNYDLNPYLHKILAFLLFKCGKALFKCRHSSMRLSKGSNFA